ncbi:hypothetical protein [Methanospirillum sp.]|nr:hypothetical protein [Methanospirillum sp.]HPP79148.1 hypothetical protein [Methanospirillum sp.]
MTSSEQMLVDTIRASGKTEFTVKELQKESVVLTRQIIGMIRV